MQFDPRWRAETDRGETLAITADAFALMQIALPPGAAYTVTLRYADDAITHIGNALSLAAFGASILGLFVARARAPRF